MWAWSDWSQVLRGGTARFRTCRPLGAELVGSATIGRDALTTRNLSHITATLHAPRAALYQYIVCRISLLNVSMSYYISYTAMPEPLETREGMEWNMVAIWWRRRMDSGCLSLEPTITGGLWVKECFLDPNADGDWDLLPRRGPQSM